MARPTPIRRSPTAVPKGRAAARLAQAVAPEAASERLQKALASAGLGSRREMEEWIAQGRVQVNGETATIGMKVGPRDVVKVSGRRVYLRFEDTRRTRILIYHKSEGEIVSRDDPKGRATVFDALPKLRGAKWISIGRLDYNTDGLMIFTTSGELANNLMHPRFEVEREYAVRILGELTDEQIQQLLDGVELDDGPAQLQSCFRAGGEGVNRWYRVVINAGDHRLPPAGDARRHRGHPRRVGEPQHHQDAGGARLDRGDRSPGRAGPPGAVRHHQPFPQRSRTHQPCRAAAAGRTRHAGRAE